MKRTKIKKEVEDTKVKRERSETSQDTCSLQKRTKIKKEVEDTKVKRERSETSQDTCSLQKRTKIKKEVEDTKVKRERSETSQDTKEDVKKIKVECKEESWQEYELLSQTQNLSEDVSKSLIKLFEEGSTIPFIARYRRNVTGDLGPEKLRQIKEEYDNICEVKVRVQNILKTVQKTGQLNESVKKAVLSAHTLEELDHIYAPYKPESKRSLSERAKALGLEKPAVEIIEGSETVNLHNFIDKSNTKLQTITEVEAGVMHITASTVASDTEVLSLLRELHLSCNYTIETKQSKSKAEATTSKVVKKDERQKAIELSKFENYFNFKASSKHIKPHQVLAINRGEVLKILSIKVTVPDFVFRRFIKFCSAKWRNRTHHKLLQMAFEDAYTRLIQPYLVRQVRSQLKAQAAKASCEVFSSNLKQLLLVPPSKGKAILGIDPGFSNGCKLALISEVGAVLATDVIYPNKRQSKNDVDVLKNLLLTHNCNLIALGNGTACRETERWLSDLLQKNTFAPLDVTYTIVNESGASIYSCSEEAKKEFSTLDPNLISAVSLARRVQEPLAELVKVEPKHLGVGMYQHDLPKKQLEQALDEVVMECVSFVGVDLNTTSQCLLKHVAGLTDKKAQDVIQYREKNGPFLSRAGLMKVKGIGSKIFQQCAGFLRVGPLNLSSSQEFYQNSDTNILDLTYIHPESYNVADDIIKKFNLNIKDVGCTNFIETVKRKTLELNTNDLSKAVNSEPETVKLILDALSKPLSFDLRSECSQKPLFKKCLTSIKDLKSGCILTGCVSNVTTFGCFVDIGVGQNGMIHNNKMAGFSLHIGDKVEVKVINVEVERKRIGLQMLNKL